jgi:hypothetical protein
MASCTLLAGNALVAENKSRPGVERLSSLIRQDDNTLAPPRVAGR